jgi:preprotein translocase subunit SecF
MWVIKYRKLFYAIGAFFVGTAIVALSLWGLNLGIDFTGGTLWEIKFGGSRPEASQVGEALKTAGLEMSVAQPTDVNGFLLRLRPLDEEQHQAGLAVLKKDFAGAQELRFEAIGPSVGKELRDKAVWAIILAMSAVILYIAWSFRKVEKVVSSWAYGAFAIIAMLHDVIWPLGVFAILGHFYNVEITSAFVAAIMTIAGYSINDTIVVMDRVRENLRKHTHDNFNELVAASLQQTIARSLNTTLTTILALVAIYFFGGESTKSFSLALIIGIVSGAYSSIFIATPLLVTWSLHKNK